MRPGTPPRSSVPGDAPGRSDEEGMGRRLYVGNLPYSAGEAELQELFSKAGTVESVRGMRDGATRRASGFAIVEVAAGEAAQKCASGVKPDQPRRRALTVHEAR